MAIDKNITQADIEALLAQNILAAEQLRRIIAERVLGELQAQMDQVSAAQNGLKAESAEGVRTP